MLDVAITGADGTIIGSIGSSAVSLATAEMSTGDTSIGAAPGAHGAWAGRAEEFATLCGAGKF
jgi:hypothetical protein